ncbi:hypothetical protein, partial [Vibrio sp. Vb1337]|uniref:hypothetical protein n=1 Tax=Vibrio sp. Vb1337 TaxID=3074641 RepID=UPI002963D83F
ITQEEKVDQVRRVTLDCQWGTGERLHYYYQLKRLDLSPIAEVNKEGKTSFLRYTDPILVKY